MTEANDADTASEPADLAASAHYELPDDLDELDDLPDALSAAESPFVAGSGAQTRRATLAWVLVCALSFITVGLIVLVVGLQGELDDERSDTPVRLAAGGFVEALMDYRYDDLESTRDAVLEASTEPFSVEYPEQFGVLRDLVTPTEVVSEVSNLDVFLSQLDGERAEAVVRATVQIQSVNGESDPFVLFFAVQLALVDGEWKVSNVAEVQPSNTPRLN